MKLFALLPLASLFLGAVANPVSVATALKLRSDSSPVAVLQQFTTDSKQYTDAIHAAIDPLTPSSDDASLGAAAAVVAQALSGLESLVTNATAVLTGNEKVARTIVLRAGDPTDSSPASVISAFLAELTGLSWNLQTLFGFSGAIGDALGPLVASVSQLWATALAL